MPKILAVDDQPHITRLVQINLQRNGYEVITAADGEEALQKVEAEKPDLIITDVMMPRKDGFALLRDLKANPETASIPVIMMTVKSQSADIHEGWMEGVDGYLTKPFDPVELLRYVRQLLESPPDPSEAGNPPADS